MLKHRRSRKPDLTFGAMLFALIVFPSTAQSKVPQIDLVNNRYLWHLQNQGLLLPLASPGVHKYCQQYRNPFGSVIEVQGHRGRILSQPKADLRFPWSKKSTAGVVRLRLLGVGPRAGISVWLNNKLIGTRPLKAEWQTVDLKITAGLLRHGENELQLRGTRRGTVNGKKAYGLLHSLEIIDAQPAPAEATWPALSPVISNKGGLGGFAQMELLVEIPPAALLKLRTRAAQPGRSRFQVRVIDAVKGKQKQLLDFTPQQVGPQEHRMDLKPWADKLVRLQFAIKGSLKGAQWVAPRIVLTGLKTQKVARFDNAIIFVGDALRSDRLRLNTKTRVRMPQLERLARKGAITFLQNQAASPSSPPSHASIQTGMIPRVHGVAGDKGKLFAHVLPISAQLKRAGIRAAYYGNNPFGMARLQKPGRWHAFHQPVREGHGSDCSKLVQLMLGYAQKQVAQKKRFFISALAYEPHVPYRYHQGISEHYFQNRPFDPPIGKRVTGDMLVRIVRGKFHITPRQHRQIVALYDGEVEYMDRCLGTLADGLQKLGQLKKTVIALTGDHGEGFGEHGGWGHAFGLWGELTNVPLVLLAPGLTPQGVIKANVTSSHLDIVPTLLHLMGVKRDPQIQGMSLVPIIAHNGRWTPRVVSIEYGRSYALRSRRFKYAVESGGTETLFDVRNDPSEQRNVKAKRPWVLRYFRDLAGIFIRHRSKWRAHRNGDLNNHRNWYVELKD